MIRPHLARLLLRIVALVIALIGAVLACDPHSEGA